MRKAIFANGKAQAEWPEEATGGYRLAEDKNCIVFVDGAGWPVKAFRWINGFGLVEVSQDDQNAGTTLYTNHLDRGVLDAAESEAELQSQGQTEAERLPADARAVYNTFRWEWVKTEKQR